MAKSRLKMTSPNEIEEMQRLPFIRCLTCNKIIGQLREAYKSLTDGGTKAPEAFKLLGLTRQCCKMNLANPSQIVPGLLYNNPRQEGSIKFSSQSAVRLLGQLSVSVKPHSPLVTVRRRSVSGAEISISRPRRLAQLLPSVDLIEIKEEGRHFTTSTLPETSIGRKPAPPSTGTDQDKITSENFSPEMIKMFKDRMSVDTGAITLPPLTGESQLAPDKQPSAPALPSLPPTQAPVSTLPILPPLPSVQPILPTHTVSQSVEIDVSTTQNLFLPTTIIRPSRKHPGEMTIVRQFSGV